jgi:hypothetical protein
MRDLQIQMDIMTAPVMRLSVVLECQLHEEMRANQALSYQLILSLEQLGLASMIVWYRRGKTWSVQGQAKCDGRD